MLAITAFPTRPVVRHPLPRKTLKPRADFNQAIEYTGKFLGLFVLFTSTANWWFYRSLRKKSEDEKPK